MSRTSDLAPTIEPIDMAAIIERLRPLSTDKLKIRFLEYFQGAASFLAESAACIHLMKERGENLNGFRNVGTFLKIASGQILPELTWAFMESPNRRRAESLPLPDQRRLVIDPMVEVIEPKPGGGFTIRKTDLTQASPEVFRLAAGDSLRSPQEQAEYLGAQKLRAATGPAVAAAEVIEEPLAHKLAVRLTSTELQILRHHAADAAVSDAEMARRFLVRAGAFKRSKS